MNTGVYTCLKVNIAGIEVWHRQIVHGDRTTAESFEWPKARLPASTAWQ